MKKQNLIKTLLKSAHNVINGDGPLYYLRRFATVRMSITVLFA